jgi:uncharacterized protein (TIGR00288 family)
MYARAVARIAHDQDQGAIHTRPRRDDWRPSGEIAAPVGEEVICMVDDEHALAVFIDFENLALGFEGAGRQRNKKKRFNIQMVLGRLVEKGKLIVKKAYADWARFPEYKAELHEAAIELIEIPKRRKTGKNSADIRLVVDAMDLSYSKPHIDTFVIVSGDSDFSPLVSKLKENGRRVIGLGMRDSTSNLLVDNCDEFIFYESLEAGEEEKPPIDGSLPSDKGEAFSLLLSAIAALQRENKEVLYSSMVKDTMVRKRPSFSEANYGYRSFSELLEDAAERGLIKLNTDARSGTYVVIATKRSRRR